MSFFLHGRTRFVPSLVQVKVQDQESQIDKHRMNPVREYRSKIFGLLRRVFEVFLILAS